MIDIKVKKINNTATLPSKAHPEDACYDLYADCPDALFPACFESKNVMDIFDSLFKKDNELTPGIYIGPKGSAMIHTGISTEIPEGYFCAVFPRSGMTTKRHLRLSNSTGIIDSNYRGEWMLSIYNDSDEGQIIHHGDRIAQFAILPVIESNISEVSDLSETTRGAGGFGSTGV